MKRPPRTGYDASKYEENLLCQEHDEIAMPPCPATASEKSSARKRSTRSSPNCSATKVSRPAPNGAAGGATPDVRVTLKTGDTVLLECKWEDSASQLESQLDTRLQQFPEALGVIGVLYPEGLKYLDDTREGLENAGDLEWWLHGSRGNPTAERRSRFGSPADIADQLRVLPLEIEGTDRVVAAAAVIEHAVEQSAVKLATHARTARRVRDVIAQTDQESDRAKALRIGCLVLFNALAFHLRLAEKHDDVAGVTEAWRDGIPGLFQVWRYICDNIDYVPVFDLAATILDILIDAPTDWHRPVLDPLLKAIDDTRRLEGHDLSGRLFHTLLTDAKFTGAYYTSVPAATLLTRLVFHNWPAGVDWSDQRVSRLAQRGRHRLRHRHPADGRGPPRPNAAIRGRRPERSSPAQGDGGAGPARLRRATLRRAFRRHQPGDAEPRHPV